MGRYYQIINGNRYIASLIQNAQRFTAGAGDGRISLKDAKDLWRMAMDGGRITETEEATLRYLMQALNWTDAATSWMQEALKTEQQELASYYQIIDGLRHDRKILNEARALTEGRGDGRISRDDAEFLLPLFGDFGDVTIVEERTLAYLLEQYTWTDTARTWFLDQVDRISRQSEVAAQVSAIMKHEFGFEQLSLVYVREEALQQQLDHENKVSLPEALRQALNSLLQSTAARSFGANLPTYTSASATEFLEGARLVLLPGDFAAEPSLDHFPSPLNGESLANHWVFGLELFDRTDDIYWVIVARDGSKPAYNYVGGPNYEAEWPRPGGTAYFLVEVRSCDQPYPGITVDVQDPNGHYTIGRSNANGQVRITGPAGMYSIYASDGWSFQSKSFLWNGKGTDQIRPVVLDC